MTIQQVVGLLAAVSAAMTGTLVASEAIYAVPTVIILVATVITSGLGAATLFLGSPANMAKALAKRSK